MIQELTRQGMFGVYGGVCGFIYGKLADLPAGSVAKAWAIWAVVSHALQQIAATFSTNPTHQVYIKLAVGSLIDGVGIYELRKRGLLGDKMMYFLIIQNLVINILYATRRVNSMVDYYNAHVGIGSRLPYPI